LTDGFGHRQAIHILLSSRALITKVRELARKTKNAVKALTGPGHLSQVSISLIDRRVE